MQGYFRSIDITKDMKIISQGNTAEVYLYENNTILKLFRDNMPQAPILAEFRNVSTIQSVLTNTPKVYEIVQCNGRYGIIYERINGYDMIKEMLSKLYRIKFYSKMLASLHAQIHYKSVDISFTVKEKLCADIDFTNHLSGFEKKKIKEYIDALPDGDRLCHFDFHPGNIMMQNTEPVIIDWMTACVGNPNADVARTCLLLQYGELQHANVVVRKLAHALEKYIGRIYLEEYKKITGVSDLEVEQWILPVASARLMEWISDSERGKLIRVIQDKLALIK